MKVSLYIPCCNAAATIQSCLRGVLKQTYPVEEIVIVDDGSTDDTVKIAARYPVRIIRHQGNKGLAAARNTAIKGMKTELIASLDADCVPEPDWLRKLVKSFQKRQIGGAGGRLLDFHSSTVIDRWRAVHMKQHWGNKKMPPSFLFGSNTVFRKQALTSIGCYHEDFKTNYEDVDVSKRLKKKGWDLVYIPKAQAHHLKQDTISSILNSYWMWNAAYYKEVGWYSGQKKFLLKLKDNLGLANRYIEEDMGAKRYELIYADFLLALHHSLRDFEYFISRNRGGYPDYPRLSIWLSLLDLTFFYHFDSSRSKLSTLMPKENAFLQNFFALNLIVDKCIRESFESSAFREVLHSHLLASVYKITDAPLIKKVVNLVELGRDWDGLFQKRHPYLHSPFLKNISLGLQEWLKNLRIQFPRIVSMIEHSASKTNAI